MHKPACPSATTCGGCPLIEVAPARARAIRELRLRDALCRQLGRARAQIPIAWVSMPQPEGYRRRIRMRVLDDARIGFFNTRKHRDCAVLTQSLRGVMSAWLDTVERGRDALAALHHLELREPDMDGIASAYFVKRAPATPLPRATLEQLGTRLDGTKWAIAGETDRVPCQRLALPSVWQYVPIGSFLQINSAINWALVADLVAGTRQRSLSTFCDLYAGSGNFTLPLLKAGFTGSSVELDPLAGSAARLSAEAQQLPQDGFAIGDAGTYAAKTASLGQSFDLVIVDPPRAGVRRELASMAALSRSHLVYCSCNLETLARDIALLHHARFELESVTLYDMFAHTLHVEAVVWLRAPLQFG